MEKVCCGERKRQIETFIHRKMESQVQGNAFSPNFAELTSTPFTAASPNRKTLADLESGSSFVDYFGTPNQPHHRLAAFIVSHRTGGWASRCRKAMLLIYASNFVAF